MDHLLEYHVCALSGVGGRRVVRTTCWGVSKLLDFLQTDPTPWWLLSSAELEYAKQQYAHKCFIVWDGLDHT